MSPYFLYPLLGYFASLLLFKMRNSEEILAASSFIPSKNSKNLLMLIC